MELFKELDRDTNGVLNEEEFRQLLACMNILVEEDIEKLLQIIDPYNNKKMTFSECIVLLSSVFFSLNHLANYQGQ